MANSYNVYINKLPLPQGLLDLIDSGRWQPPADQSKVDLVFPERGELRLYSLGYMPFENERWVKETNPVFFGLPDDTNPPGDIDPHQSILIGDLGAGYDQPIALDYRVSLHKPRILILKWSQSGRSNRWVELASDIRTFSELLGL